MDQQRSAEAEVIYRAIWGKPPDEREKYLAEACSKDPSLRAEVELLLGSEDFDADLTEQAERLKTLRKIRNDADAERTRAHDGIIGPYHLLQKIGGGGMGEVWLAEQKQPVRRKVAIKLIKLGMDSPEVMARFDSERQALALMDHPVVAKVFDGGTTASGRPYFVMEYVAGIPITEYCDKHKLTVPERLELFMKVCEGARHAHQKAIIHRDLKPSNILVKDVGGKPEPKIIDFGIAKAVAQQLTDFTLVTRVGTVLGTLEYMSPEQADSGGENIDTRTDVYSLGVILYELLAGTVPINLGQMAFEEILRKLRLEEAPRPSTKLASLGPQSTVVAQNHRTEPRTLSRQLRGDLDAIVMKALEKERSRRYGSVEQFADDIHRHLSGEPVKAAAPSITYHLGKFVRRHRPWLAAAAAFLLLLVVGGVASAWMAVRATRAEQEAQAVNNFLQSDLLAQAGIETQALDVNNKPEPDLKVRTALDRAAAKIAGKFAAQPLVEVSIRRTMGKAYYELGLYAKAQEQMERLIPLESRILGDKTRSGLQNKRFLAMMYMKQSNFKAAEALYATTLTAERQLFGDEDADTLICGLDLAALYKEEGKYPEAEKLGLQIVNAQQRRFGKENTITLKGEVNLAGVYISENKFAQAEPLMKELVDSMIRVHGEQHPDTLATMGNLALLYGFENKFHESAAIYERVVAGLRQIGGNEYPFTLLMADGLAWAYDHQARYDLSDALFAEVIQSDGRVLGKGHPQTLIAMTDLASSYRRRGMNAQTEALLVPVLKGRRLKLGIRHPDTLASMGDLGWLYVAEGRNAEAESLLREATAVFEKTASDDWERYRILCALGASLAGQRKYEAAEPMVVNGYTMMAERKAMIPADGRFELEQAGRTVVGLYKNWGKPDKAREWQKKLQDSGLSI